VPQKEDKGIVDGPGVYDVVVVQDDHDLPPRLVQPFDYGPDQRLYGRGLRGVQRGQDILAEALLDLPKRARQI
jgi:hypothetical protein